MKQYAEGNYRKSDALEVSVLYASLVLLVLQPFLPAVDLISPLRIGGFSLIITVIPTLILFGCFCIVGYRIPRYAAYIALITLALTAVNQFRELLGISASEGLVRDLNRLRYMILVPMNFAIWGYLLRRASARRILGLCLATVTIVLGFLGFLYAIDVARIGTIILDPVNGQQVLLSDIDRVRYGGFQTSNSFGCLLVTLMCYLVFADEWKRKNIRLFSLAMAFAGILPTLSRGPIIIGACLIVTYIVREGRSVFLGVVALVICAGGVFVLKREQVSDVFSSSMGRVAETVSVGTGREDKLRYGVATIMASPEAIALGVPDYMTSFGAAEEQSISDNSLILAAASGGVPLVLLVVSCTWLIIVGAKRNSNFNLGFIASIILFIVICNLYNAVIWNSWLPYVSAVVMLLYLGGDVRTAVEVDRNYVSRPRRNFTARKV